MALSFDIAVIGASFGGVSAALAAARFGKRIALVDAAGNVGGQATAQGVTRWDESAPVMQPYGSSSSYQTLKNDIRAWYRANSKLAPGINGHTFNPGFSEGGHPFSADSNVVETVLRQLLKDAPNIQLMLDTVVVGADVDGAMVRSLTLGSGDALSATVFIDATDLGDLFPLYGLSWVIGAEAKDDTEEPHAEAKVNPEHIQPITVPIAIERRPAGEDHTIPQPPNYSQALIDDQAFDVYDKRNGMIGGVFSSSHSLNPGWETLFNYRQYIDHRNFDDPAAYGNDRTTINVGCNDYQAAVIPTGDPARDAAIVEEARAVSIAYLYWLQTKAPSDDGSGKGYPNLMVREDIFGRADGTAPQAYIRESRRLAKPIVRILEQHISVPDRSTLARAPMNFSDSCGICMYGIDIHQCYGPAGTPWVGGITVRPFQIPLGSLIPTEPSNIIAGCKNIGATHLTSGAYRVHPGEWAVGEAAGTLAAYCVGQNVLPMDVHANGARVAAMQLRLLEQGIPIFWWDDLSYENDPKTFAAANLIGARRLMSDPGSLHFRPKDMMTQSERDAIDSQVGRQLPWPTNAMIRAQAAMWLCAELGLPSSEIVQHWGS